MDPRTLFFSLISGNVCLNFETNKALFAEKLLISAFSTTDGPTTGVLLITLTIIIVIICQKTSISTLAPWRDSKRHGSVACLIILVIQEGKKTRGGDFLIEKLRLCFSLVS